MKKISTILFAMGMLLSSCSYERDTYEEPKGSIFGLVTDSGSDQPIQTRYNGALSVRILEQAFENPAPIDLTVSPEGSFRSDRVFAGTYEVFPFNGPFRFDGAPTLVDTESGGEVNFMVTPFLRIAITNVSGNTLAYEIEKTDAAADVIQEVIFMYNTYEQVDEAVTTNSNTGNNFTIGVEEAILGTPQTYSFPDGELASGTTYYMRIGARIVNQNWNYSPVVAVTVP